MGGTSYRSAQILEHAGPRLARRSRHFRMSTQFKDYHWTLSGGLLDLVFLLFGVALLVKEAIR